MTAQVVVVGAGFGGLAAAKGLRDAPVGVTLVDANNFHTFQPLLYQVATARPPNPAPTITTRAADVRGSTMRPPQ